MCKHLARYLHIRGDWAKEGGDKNKSEGSAALPFYDPGGVAGVPGPHTVAAAEGDARKVSTAARDG